MTYIEQYLPALAAEVADLAHQVIQQGSTAQSLGAGHKR